MKRSSSHYWKVQTLWTFIPAMLDAKRGESSVMVRIYPTRRPSDPPCDPALVALTPNEAIGFAAWLHEQAEHIIAKQAKAAARKAARLAAKEGL